MLSSKGQVAEDSRLSTTPVTVYSLPYHELASLGAHKNFDYGVLQSCPATYHGVPMDYCNGSTLVSPGYSFAYQAGFTSNALIRNSNWLVELSNIGYTLSTGNAPVAHASIIGTQSQWWAHNYPWTYASGDAWWHNSWVWGGVISCPFGQACSYNPQVTSVETAPINSLVQGQVDGQTFEAIDGSTHQCVHVNSGGYAGIKSLADAQRDESMPIGEWLASWGGTSSPYPSLWTDYPSQPCTFVTWTYANGVYPSDNSILW